MKPFHRQLSWLALAIIAGLIWMLWPSDPEPSQVQDGEPSRKSEQTPAVPVRIGSQNASGPEPVQVIDDALARLLTSQDAAQSTTILAELRDAIQSADQTAAAAAITRFLETSKDAPTRLPLVVGPDGALESSPTLRIALMDLLPALDPAAALEIAHEIMDLKNSPDEYALALRNLAWNDLDGDLKPELSRRFEQMIETVEWRKTPSSGFLEGLDAAVELSDDPTFEVMLRLNAEATKDQNASLGRASFIALDRMVLREPSVLEKSYARDPEMAGISPDQRASLMSRLNIEEPAQRELFVQYLADPQKGPEEMDYFVEIFPNGNYLHGNWLITSLEPTHSIETRLRADQGILQQLETLRIGNDNQQSRDAMDRIRERLLKSTAAAPQK